VDHIELLTGITQGTQAPEQPGGNDYTQEEVRIGKIPTQLCPGAELFLQPGPGK